MATMQGPLQRGEAQRRGRGTLGLWRSCYGGLERSQGAVKQNRPAPRVGGWEVGDSWVRAEVTPGSSWQEKQGGVGSMGTGEAWAAVCCAGGRERPVWTRGWRLCWGGGLSWAQGRSWAGPLRKGLPMASPPKQGQEGQILGTHSSMAGSLLQEEAALRVPALGSLSVWIWPVTVHQPEPSSASCPGAATRATARAACPNRRCLSNSL